MKFIIIIVCCLLVGWSPPSLAKTNTAKASIAKTIVAKANIAKESSILFVAKGGIEL